MTRPRFLPALCLLAAFALTPWPTIAMADDAATPAAAADESAKTDAFLKSLQLQTGTVSITKAQASLKLAPGYSFLRATDAQRVLNELWGNPPDSDVLGMILPGTDPKVLLDGDAWAVVVSYTDEGYVSDADAAKIDYSDMLKDMQKGAEEENPERIKQGYPAIELVGWAEPPHYDAASHKLYWARDLKFKKSNGAEDGHSLNYAIRVLGRQGYLSLNAVAPIDQLNKVRADMPQVLAMTEFDQGQRYADYNSSTDKLAAYGIGALVAGGIAAKAGLFAKLGLILLGLKKFLLIGIAAIGGFFAKLFKRNKST
ncbi:DUF2167 domain-containing protein [Dyella tabacisoli]|uniref:DUF2167 domain-containing protein n=1 Tax=Dyella tabacisoli TaxID=2282381 RepID=A0A369UQY6_9GAMM|nr:DUF2167 domain-containing protein [Dyella tabacisoli]RDD80729.1 DUF2167 domain-containing protein [Dyella tabacisoli]